MIVPPAYPHFLVTEDHFAHVLVDALAGCPGLEGMPQVVEPKRVSTLAVLLEQPDRPVRPRILRLLVPGQPALSGSILEDVPSAIAS